MILNAYSYNENKSDKLAHSIKTQTLYIDSVDNIFFQLKKNDMIMGRRFESKTNFWAHCTNSSLGIGL